MLLFDKTDILKIHYSLSIDNYFIIHILKFHKYKALKIINIKKIWQITFVVKIFHVLLKNIEFSIIFKIICDIAINKKKL